MASSSSIVLLFLFSTGGLVEGFYLPVRGPTAFCSESTEQNASADCQSEVYVHANKITSFDKILPYEYSSFDFCGPPNSTNGQRNSLESLGQILLGERLYQSAYNMSFGNSVFDRKLCEKNYDPASQESEKHLQFLLDRVQDNYRHSWVIDDLPVTWCYAVLESDAAFCGTHFPLGCHVSVEGVKYDACYLSERLNENGAAYLFNHIDFTIFFTQRDDYRGANIVRAQIQPKSCDTFPCHSHSRPKKLPPPSEIPDNFSIVYSYSVHFEETYSIHWASRWNYILTASSQANVQWFNLLNSAVITVFLFFLVIVILVRHKRKDLSVEQWSLHVFLLRGDLFQPPKFPMPLSVFLGSGAQLFCTIVLTLLFACSGLLSPPNRGALVIAVLLFYVVMAAVAGFLSARQYKKMGGQRRVANVALTGLLIPGLVFGTFFVVNLFLRGASLSAGVPFTTVLVVLALWLGVSLPLVVIGSCLGYRTTESSVGIKQPAVERVDLIPDVSYKPQRSTAHCCCCCSVVWWFGGGLLSFSTIFIQLYFVLDSVWRERVYYAPGQSTLVFLALVVVSSLSSIPLCYFKLRSENTTHWMWSSFFSSVSTTCCFFLHCVLYFSRSQLSGGLFFVAYFGFSFVLSLVVFLLVGSIGFFACWIFVCALHSMSQKKLAISNLNM